MEQKQQFRDIGRNPFRIPFAFLFSHSFPFSSETFAEMTPIPKGRGVQQVAVRLLCVLVGILSGPSGTMIKAWRDTDSLDFRGFPRP